MTAPTTAASNGHTKFQPTPERTHGMARVQEAEGWHLASVARDAVGEAERLCSDIMHVASAAYTRETGPATFTDPALVAKANEALACLATAVIYLAELFGEPELPEV
jgi:hypothetical protein